MPESYLRSALDVGNRLRDAAGNEVSGFSDEPVANAAADTTPPTLKKTPQGAPEETVSLTGLPAIDGATVTLTLESAVLATDTGVKVSYARPTSGTGNRIVDAAGNQAASFTDLAVVPDGTPPRLVRGEIDSGTMTLYFSEALDPDSVGGQFVVFVFLAVNRPHGFYATGDVEIDGNKVTVGLGKGNPQAQPGLFANTYYEDPAAKGLRDLAGNPVTSTRAILLDNLTGVAPAVTGVAVSSEAGADDTYGLGDTVRVRLTFNKAVNVTGTPRLKIDFSTGTGDERWAAYASGSGTKALEFAYTVAASDVSAGGVAVLANTLALNGGAIGSALTAGENAALAHAGLGHDTNHKVDGTASSDGEAVGNSGPRGTGGDGGPLAVTGVAVVSSPASGDTYLLGEKIRVRVSFGAAVAVTGSPVLGIDMDPAAWGAKQAVYESGGGTAALTFAHTVAEPNHSTQGIAVLADSLALAGGTIRSAATGADAALGHSGLGHDADHKVDWRPAISVADARADEGANAAVAFEVSLDRAFTTAGHSVTVDYATADGTAKAGEDYTAASGTLTFAAGETAKTVSVAVLDDAVDEGEETFTLRLSNATGARIADGEAVGTISNEDPLQKIWLARFGRTVAIQTVEALEGRFAIAPDAAPRMAVTLAGRNVDLAQIGEGAALSETLTGLARAFGAPDPAAANDNGPFARHGLGGAGVSAPARGLTGRELLRGGSFHFTTGAASGLGDGAMTGWGKMLSGGSSSSLAGGLSFASETATGVLGLDWERDRLLVGVALSRTVETGSASFAPTGSHYEIEGRLSMVTPYLRVRAGERLSFWSAVGSGSGSLSLTRDGGSQTAAVATRLAAAGGRAELLRPGAGGGLALALKTDAFFVRSESARVSTPGVGNLAAATGDASRVRAVMEGSRSFALAAGGALEPSLSLGLRHDGGDAETGTGVEFGAGLSWSAPASGLTSDLRLYGLAAHEAGGYDEWGASGSLRLAPDPSGRGLSLSMAPSWGAPGQAGRLWGAAPGALAANDNGGGGQPGGRLDTELGYGLALPDGLTGTPYAGFGFGEAGARDWRLGWRLASDRLQSFSLDLETTRREPANPGPGSGAGRPEHGVMLRSAVRW